MPPDDPPAPVLEPQPIDRDRLALSVGGNRLTLALTPLLRGTVLNSRAASWTYQPNALGRLFGLTKADANMVPPRERVRWQLEHRLWYSPW